ncbi:uncharacterized protein [Leptinotarsa decemlineata]|uniref:uncharacterized protein n=1 Tax=Leptinotarsa decemlineata TaxID=7539 RepID=UPI003D305389
MISGAKSDFEKVRKGLGEYIFEQVEKYADNIYQIDGETGEKETFSSVGKRSSRLAINLKKLGLTNGDIVITCLKNNLNSVIPHIAVLYCGAKFAALDPIQTEKEWIHCVNLVKPKFIFVDEEHSEKMEKSIDRSEVKSVMVIAGKSDVHQTLGELLSPSKDEDRFFPEIIQDCYSTAVISFSSGTTGLPKGVCHCHFGLINMVINYSRMDMYDPGMVLVYSTFYWITSLFSFIRAFQSGGCRITSNRFHPEKALEMMEKFKVTHCLLPPKAAKEFLKVKDFEKYDTSSLHHFLTGGATITPDCLIRLRQLFKHSIVSNSYGSSEVGPIAAFDLSKDKHLLSELLSVGRCTNDIEIKIIDQDMKHELGPNEEGEIWVRSPYATTGYYNLESSSPFDSEGFLKTGDTGYYDENECLFITGRCNEIFKNGSIKVVPSQWEVILQEHPAIEEVAVFGLPQENGDLYPAACIVLKKNTAATAEEIEEFFISRMTGYHRLEGGIKFVDQLPRTPSSKLKRVELYNMFINANK